MPPTMPTSFEFLRPGKDVLYNLPHGERRPAKVVRVADKEGTVDLLVFLSSQADQQAGFTTDELRLSVAQRAGVKHGDATHNWSYPAHSEVNINELSSQLSTMSTQLQALSGSVEHIKERVSAIGSQATAEIEGVKKTLTTLHPAAASPKAPVKEEHTTPGKKKAKPADDDEGGGL